MATKLATQNISDAKAAIAAYKSSCDAAFKSLDGAITGIMGEQFLGEAASGYEQFYSQIKPAVSTKLYGDSESITSMLDSIITAVEQMLNPVDPQLGTANQNAGNE